MFYGWYVVYALCLVITFTSGLIFYNLSVLLDAFVTQRGFPVGLSSIATGSFFVASGVAGLAAGYLIDRIDVRFVMIASACVGALALGTVGWLREPWQLIAFYIAFGCCYGGVGLVPNSTVVARWFYADRSKALAVAFTGFSVGGILITPIVALMVKQLSLDGAAPWLAAALFLGIVPAIALVVRASPQSMGLKPHGAGAANVTGTAFAVAIRSRFFVTVTVAFTCAYAAQLGAIAHLFRLVNLRTGAETAALALSLLAAASLAGRLAGGWLLATVPARAFSFGLLVLQTLALAVLAFANSRIVILFGVAAFGAGIGSILMMQQILTAEAFGTRDYGRIYAFSQLIAVAGIACGPPLVGLLNESTGSYMTGYLSVAAISLAGLAMMILSGPPTAQPPRTG
jgi:MFS family permease